MARLPQIKYSDGIRKSQVVTFGGYNHNAAAKEGQIYDMKNMTGDYAPLLATRKKRYLVRTIGRANGIYAHDVLYWVDGTGFFRDGILKGTVTDSKKQITSLGSYIIIFPDKAYYNMADDTFGSLESEKSGSATIKDGTFVGEPAKGNTIYMAGVNFKNYFKQGDAVTISGAAKHKENNKTAVIREIDGENLRFYENTFVIGSGGDSETLTIKRAVPDMDFICENENRLWGCKGDTIYASKLGDPFNFNVFDGVATDSYAVNVGSSGDFTGCVKFLGHTCFFKEESIYKVYGNKPSNFQVMGSGSLGVESGSAGSLAIASERMFYLSRAGFVVYTGGIPQDIGKAFGDVAYSRATAGTDGRKYYVSAENQGVYFLFVYTPSSGMWHKEGGLWINSFAYLKGLYMLEENGRLWFLGERENVPVGAEPESDFDSMVEFADFEEGSPNKKRIAKLQLRIEMEEGAKVTVFLQFDSSGVWEEVQVVKADRKKSFYLPIIPRRCDHFRIKIEGRGQWKLHSLVKEIAHGSEL